MLHFVCSSHAVFGTLSLILGAYEDERNLWPLWGTLFMQIFLAILVKVKREEVSAPNIRRIFFDFPILGLASDGYSRLYLTGGGGGMAFASANQLHVYNLAGTGNHWLQVQMAVADNIHHALRSRLNKRRALAKKTLSILMEASPRNLMMWSNLSCQTDEYLRRCDMIYAGGTTVLALWAMQRKGNMLCGGARGDLVIIRSQDGKQASEASLVEIGRFPINGGGAENKKDKLSVDHVAVSETCIAASSDHGELMVLREISKDSFAVIIKGRIGVDHPSAIVDLCFSTGSKRLFALIAPRAQVAVVEIWSVSDSGSITGDACHWVNDCSCSFRDLPFAACVKRLRVIHSEGREMLCVGGLDDNSQQKKGTAEITFLDAESMEVLNRVRLRGSSQISCMQSAENGLVVCGCENQYVLIQTGWIKDRCRTRYIIPNWPIELPPTGVAFLHQGRVLAISGSDFTLTLIDLRTAGKRQSGLKKSIAMWKWLYRCITKCGQWVTICCILYIATILICLKEQRLTNVI